MSALCVTVRVGRTVNLPSGVKMYTFQETAAWLLIGVSGGFMVGYTVGFREGKAVGIVRGKIMARKAVK